MTTTTTATGPRRPRPVRLMLWGVLAGLLSLPAILGFPWTASDFVLMALMLGALGGGIEYLFARSANPFARAGSAMLVIVCFLTIWVNLAVGMIGSEDNPYNLLFMGLVPAAIAGAVLVRFRPAGLAWIALGCGLVQAALALEGMAADPRGGRLSLLFVVFWLIAAGLFRAGARR
ncbi:hypothetical protein [Sphingomonas astaxanthinifaciens]|uniref:Uncharacterized protein n=1 Tax=Sphingomonas astaxanthinifaciens DSM 22298 TaxID=1123267 RepID=A0ABQ5Z9C6_9SPHN|nr:hypothetical protein [Sphingomonas astaxanthinifaciens]GLR48542.1 hypothetical protein GCM10007925_22590 [Sphingomonas astaxanthinifaciens DSM 22298]